MKTQLDDVKNARSSAIDLVKAGGPSAWGPILVSTIVTVGFFAILFLFVTGYDPVAVPSLRGWSAGQPDARPSRRAGVSSARGAAGLCVLLLPSRGPGDDVLAQRLSAGGERRAEGVSETSARSQADVATQSQM